MKILIFVFLVCFSSFGFASVPSSEACCVCQTGEAPQYQTPFFAIGCAMWMSVQSNCSFRSIRTIERYVPMSLPLSCKNKTLKLGYVGHWGSTEELIEQLRRSVLPTTVSYNMSVEIDNTACMSMDDPPLMQKFLKSLPMQDRYVRIKGNQTISIGMNDAYTPGRNAISAVSDSRALEAEYPKCSDYHNRSCTKFPIEAWAQSGGCRDQSGALRSLSCCKVQQEYEVIAMEEVVKRKRSATLWKFSEECR